MLEAKRERLEKYARSIAPRGAHVIIRRPDSNFPIYDMRLRWEISFTMPTEDEAGVREAMAVAITIMQCRLAIAAEGEAGG